MAKAHYMGWWNLENLFDEENSLDRTDKVRRALGQSIVGWTPALRDRKISQLASVIIQMNDGAGPDLLGVCEVENRTVLDLLVAEVNARLPIAYIKSCMPTHLMPAESTSHSFTTLRFSRSRPIKRSFTS